MRKLLRGTEQLKRLLSTLPEAAVDVDSLSDGRDAHLKLSRAQFDDIIRPLIETVATVARRVAVAVESIAAVELVGGGTRVPAVMAAISAAVGSQIGYPRPPLSKFDASAPSRTLDAAVAAAYGAASMVAT